MTRAMFVEIDAWDPNRINLVPWPRDFSNAAWIKTAATIGANVHQAPDNLLQADKLIESSTNAGHYVDAPLITAADTSQPVTVSIYAKAAGRSQLRIATHAGIGFPNVARTIVDLSSGACANATAGAGVVLAAYAIKGVGGWWRCVLTTTPEPVNSNNLLIRIQLVNAGAQSYLGDGTSGIYLDQVLVEAGAALGEPIGNEAAGPGILTLRYASVAYVSSPNGTPPNAVFDPRIDEALSFSRQMFGDFRVKSGGEAGYGLIKLRNNDHALAPLLDYGLVGREARIYFGDTSEIDYPFGLTEVLRGTVDQIEVGASNATIRLRDRQAVLEQSLQPTKYAGTNALPAGVEGVAADIKGQDKPSCWGRCYHVPAVLVNTARLIYQVNSGPVQAIDAVYEGGAAITYSGVDHASLAAIEAASPTAGQFDKCTALGLFRLGSSATLRITADVRGDNAGGYVNRTGAIIRRILEARAGVATADIDTAAFAALDAAANYEVGFYTAEPSTLAAAIAAIRQSVAAWCVPDRVGDWQAGRLEAPAVTPDFTLTDTEILDVDRLPSSDEGGGVPVWRVELRYKPFFVSFTEADLAAGLAQALKAEFTTLWRTAAAEDTSVKTAHPLAATLKTDTLLTTEADALAEAARLLALHSVRRDLVRVRIAMTDAHAEIDLGATLMLLTPALGYGAGRSFRVVGVTPEDRVIDLLLWG